MKPDRYPRSQSISTPNVTRETTSVEAQNPLAEQTAEVSMVRVKLVQSLRLLPHQGASVSVRLDPGCRLPESELMLLESSGRLPTTIQWRRTCPSCRFNPTGCSCSVGAGVDLGEASFVTLVQPDQFSSRVADDQSSEDGAYPVIKRITDSEVTKRKQLL